MSIIPLILDFLWTGRLADNHIENKLLHLTSRQKRNSHHNSGIDWELTRQTNWHLIAEPEFSNKAAACYTVPWFAKLAIKSGVELYGMSIT
ncbi:hypothetical protein J6590_003253 [Homalodisca vitripennis]|nr:hypothetical protein J6590_003253 [Homalodisca vitripennis]